MACEKMMFCHIWLSQPKPKQTKRFYLWATDTAVPQWLDDNHNKSVSNMTLNCIIYIYIYTLNATKNVFRSQYWEISMKSPADNHDPQPFPYLSCSGSPQTILAPHLFCLSSDLHNSNHRTLTLDLMCFTIQALNNTIGQLILDLWGSYPYQ